MLHDLLIIRHDIAVLYLLVPMFGLCYILHPAL